MSKKICLTGVKPTEMPHLGNYIGAIKPAIEMSNNGEYDGYLFIADYHSLIGVHKGSELRDYIYEVAAVWLACGLDPEKTTLYKQSDIPVSYTHLTLPIKPRLLTMKNMDVTKTMVSMPDFIIIQP